MTKYTELLSEYIENGGELPAVFEQIANFEDLFIGRYCDCEIGFETPILFQIKLETRANLIIPQYVKRLSAFEEAEQLLIQPTKKRVKSGSITYGGEDTHTFTASDHIRNESELPFVSSTNTPPVTQQYTDKGHTDTDTIKKGTTETYNNVTDTESGYTSSEAETLYKALEEPVRILLEDCLNEFKNLFMKVY